MHVLYCRYWNYVSRSVIFFFNYDYIDVISCTAYTQTVFYFSVNSWVALGFIVIRIKD